MFLRYTAPERARALLRVACALIYCRRLNYARPPVRPATVRTRIRFSYSFRRFFFPFPRRHDRPASKSTKNKTHPTHPPPPRRRTRRDGWNAAPANPRLPLRFYCRRSISRPGRRRSVGRTMSAHTTKPTSLANRLVRKTFNEQHRYSDNIRIDTGKDLTVDVKTSERLFNSLR